MYLPLFSKKEQLQELVTFPPLDTGRSFYMPLSAPRGLISQLQQVPFFRIPKTLGWPFLDSPMPSFSPPQISLQPLLDLLGVLPYFLLFFFYCKAELAIKPCRSSRSHTRGGFEKFHDTCKTGNKNTTKQTTTPQPNSPKHQQNKQENGKCHWMVRQVVKKSETSEAAQRSHMLNSTRKHKVSLVLCR